MNPSENIRDDIKYGAQVYPVDLYFTYESEYFAILRSMPQGLRPVLRGVWAADWAKERLASPWLSLLR